MSAKSLRNRLENLFSDLRQEDSTPGLAGPRTVTGWTWEAGSDDRYTSLSPEVQTALGYPPESMLGQDWRECGLTPESQQALRRALATDQLPLEVEVSFITASQALLLARLVVTNGPGVHSPQAPAESWRGFCQVLAASPIPQRRELPQAHTPATPRPAFLLEAPPPTSPQPAQLPLPAWDAPQGFLLEGQDGNGFAHEEPLRPRQAAALTPLGEDSLRTQAPQARDGLPGKPAAMAVSAQIGQANAQFLLELIDDTPHRKWSEDERLLVEQVSNQLALALDNARLFQQTQAALGETQARAQELLILNEMSRALNMNLDIDAILRLVHHYTGRLMDASNFYIAFFHEDNRTLSFPYVVMHGKPVVEGQPEKAYWVDGEPASGLTAYVISTRQPLLIEADAQRWLEDQHIDAVALGRASAASWLGAPMLVGDRITGVAAVQSETTPRLYNQHHAALLATIANQAAIAIENARLLEQTQAALKETEALYHSSARLNTAQSYLEILTALHKYSLLGMADVNTTINIFDRPWTANQTPEWIHVIASQRLEGEQRMAARFSLKAFPSPAIFLQPSTATILRDLRNDPRLDEDTRALLSQNGQADYAILLPLISAGRWIGFINGMFSQPVEFSENEMRRLMALVNQASIAIQNHRLLEESRKRADQLQIAAEIARDTSGTLALDALLKRAVNLVRDRFNFYHASVFLLDESRQRAVVREATGEAGAEMKRRNHSLAVGSQSIVGAATQSGESLVVNDVYENPVHSPNPLLPHTRSELGIPLKISNQVIGALDVQSTEVNAFGPDDVGVLQILADQIAVAIENARAYELSQRAMEEMRKADQLKSQFLANMSHELRTPLNSIIGFSRVIMKGIDGPINAVQEEDLTAIYNSGQHLLNLINDILDLSKIEAGKMDLAFEEDVDLVELVSSVMLSLKALAKDKPIELRQEVAPDLPRITADSTKVRQVLLNLVSNAAKFTDSGSITIEARPETGSDGEPRVRLIVTDSGVGIAEEEQAKLFQPFSQVDASPTRKTGGSGLGLSISRHLVEMHGGAIGVTSSPGKGSTFYFTLPLQPKPPSDETQAADTLEMSARKPCILVLEGLAQVASVYERFLDKQGFQVVTLDDPRLACERARQLKPAALLLDVALRSPLESAYDGWQALADLKAHPETRETAVVVCSLLDEAEKAIRLGAQAFLRKPFLEDELLAALNKQEPAVKVAEILVIDDDPQDLRLIEKIFQTDPRYSLRLARSGEDALRMLDSWIPQAIILDLYMPGLDGFEFLNRLRADIELKHIPVVIYTAGDLDDEQQTRVAVYSQAVLRKGIVKGDELLQTIDRILEG